VESKLALVSQNIRTEAVVKCHYHPERDAFGGCKSCDRALCRNCAVDCGYWLACRGSCEEVVHALQTRRATARLDGETRERLEAALHVHDLKRLVDELRHAGVSQAAIYDRFDLFHQELEDSGRIADLEAIESALDRIWGFCSSPQQWFDSDTLTNGAMNAYYLANLQLGDEGQ
jgi:hypothetical protein